MIKDNAEGPSEFGTVLAKSVIAVLIDASAEDPWILRGEKCGEKKEHERWIKLPELKKEEDNIARCIMKLIDTYYLLKN